MATQPCFPAMESSGNVVPESRIAAGAFGEWLTATRDSLRGTAGTDVPCGDCVGCCVSSYYIPVRPEDRGALAVIPAHLLLEADGAPTGHRMLGYRPDGTCHMLNAGQCSIYAQRPQTCRDYDCRIFAAAGIDAGGPDKGVINRRVRSWRFTYASDAEREAHAAVRAAAMFIRETGPHLTGVRFPTAPTGIAVLALKSYGVFMDDRAVPRSVIETARSIIDASREFDSHARPGLK